MYLTLYRDTHAGREIITGVAATAHNGNVRVRPARLTRVNVEFRERPTCMFFNATRYRFLIILIWVTIEMYFLFKLDMYIHNGKFKCY